MRIVTWNCNMALHRKFDALISLRPDIAIVPECADPETLRRKMEFPDDVRVVWVGENSNKGLGIFAFNKHNIDIASDHDPEIRHIAPVHISGVNSFNLLAVWAMNTKENGWSAKRRAPFLSSLDRYPTFLENNPSMIAGDFNNHVRWDKPGHRNNQADAVDRLKSMGLVSAYHTHNGLEHGAETEPTHYWRDRSKEGPTYHIDYIFLPVDWASHMTEMTVGTFEDWCGNKLSDHVPLVVDIDIS